MKKRLLALLLTLVMVVSILPTSVLAAPGDAPGQENLTPGPVISDDELVTVEKKAQAVNGLDDTYDVTLTVTTTDMVEVQPQTPAHVVLVIDASGSMKGDRLAKTKAAAKEFAGIVLGEDAADDNQVAVVTYSDNGELKQGFTKNVNQINTAIDGIQANGGTNIQSGLYFAEEAIRNDNDASNAKKVILLFSDGYPTYCYELIGTASGECNGSGTLGGLTASVNADSIQITGRNVKNVIGAGSDDEVTGEWWDIFDLFASNLSLSATCTEDYLGHDLTWGKNHTFPKGVKYNYETKALVNKADTSSATLWEGDQAKVLADVYTVLLKPTNSGEAEKAEGLMQKLATGGNYHTAENAEDLAKLFKGIADDVVKETNAGKVSDPMAQFVMLDKSSISDTDAVEVKGNSFTWDVSESVPVEKDGSKIYTLTYRVSLDTDHADFETGVHPLNGTTTFTYSVDGEEKNVAFNVPTVYEKAVRYQVKYSWMGAPEDAVLPATVSELADGAEYTVDGEYTAGQVIEIKDDNGNVTGKYTFSGWKLNDTLVTGKQIINASNVTLAGTWTYEEITPNPNPDPDWDVSRSKTATNLDSDFVSEVTLSLPSAEEQLVSDVVFVLDKSTSATVEDQMLRMLRDLNTQAKETGAKIKVGVVIFNKQANRVLELTELSDASMDAIDDAIRTEISSGTNTHAGLLAGKAMLDSDTGVDANRKYLIFVSDGITYMYNAEPTATAWSFWADEWKNWAGPDNWASKYGNNNAPGDWDSWMTDIGAKVANQGTAYEYAYGGQAGPATPQENWQTAYANSVDKALYLTYQTYQAAENAGYHCYAMAATTNANYPWASSFMNYLADGKHITFEGIKNDIYYLVSAGSQVIDYMGKGSWEGYDYDFDFVTGTVNLLLKVGTKTLSSQEITPTVYPNPDMCYGFGTKAESSSLYPYELYYFAGSQTQQEHFIWVINVPVTNFAPVQLTYKVKLANPKTTPGTYGQYDADGSEKYDGLFTNNSAVLNPVDSNGLSGVNQVFPKPTVSYTIAANPDLFVDKTVVRVGGTTVTNQNRIPGAVAGETIRYQIVVENTGDVTLTDVKITDNLWEKGTEIKVDGTTETLTGSWYTINSLRPDDTVTITYSYKVTLQDSLNGSVKNKVSVIYDNGPTTTDEETVKVYPVVIPDVPEDNTPNWLNLDDHYAYIVGYNDGMVKPGNNITRAEVATIFFRLLTDEAREYFWSTDSGFSDVKSGDWYNNAVSTMVNAGIITGYADGTFKPNANITRAEFATIAARFLSNPYSLKDRFYDTEGHWAEVYINRAAEIGWIGGYPDGSFKPDRYITRAEAVTLVNNVLGREPHEDYLLEDMIRWPDNPKTAWFYEDVQEATNSHDYRWSSSKSYEIWTELLENRNWARLEKEWSNAYSAPGGSVIG